MNKFRRSTKKSMEGENRLNQEKAIYGILKK